MAHRGNQRRHAELHILMLIDFMGHKTHLIDGLPGKSKSFIDLLQHPLALDMADHYLLPSCLHYLLSTAQAIEIESRTRRSSTSTVTTRPRIHPPMLTDRDAVPTVNVAAGSRSSSSTLCDFAYRRERRRRRWCRAATFWPDRRRPRSTR